MRSARDTARQKCIDLIERLSPGTLQSFRTTPQDEWEGLTGDEILRDRPTELLSSLEARAKSRLHSLEVTALVDPDDMD